YDLHQYHAEKTGIRHAQVHGNEYEKHEEDDELRVSDLRIPFDLLRSNPVSSDQLCHVYGSEPGSSCRFPTALGRNYHFGDLGMCSCIYHDALLHEIGRAHV